MGGGNKIQAKVSSTKTRVPAKKVPSIKMDTYTLYVPPGPDRLPDVPINLMEKIRDGMKKVKHVRLNTDKCVPISSSQKGIKKCLGNYVIAATNAQGKIKLIEIYGGEPSAAGFSIACERKGACESGVNPPFIILSPPGWTVVALRTVVLDRNKHDGAKPAVYIPYSSRLNTPQLRKIGLEYIRSAILGAWYELRAKKIESLYIEDYLITDFGTPDHVVTLILTEQVLSDVGFVQGTEAEKLEMLNRALVTLAVNGSESFQYTISSVGAMGLGQGMASSYQSTRGKYPKADLPEDDVEGRKNHHSTIKMMVCHTDAEWWAIESLKEVLLKDTWKRRLVFAAGYNASIGTVRKALDRCNNKNWRTCKQLPSQTQRYLVKYEWIYKVLFDQVFRSRIRVTPVARDVTPLVARKTKTPM